VLTVTATSAPPTRAGGWSSTGPLLERMRRVRPETAEPFLKRRVTFEGVVLDDYKVQCKVADVRNSQVLLATRADGRRMPVGSLSEVG
jgi:hypothetical protein